VGAKTLNKSLNATSTVIVDGPGLTFDTPAVPKWCKTIVAILLLPICVGAGLALWMVVRASGSADTTWVPALAGWPVGL